MGKGDELQRLGILKFKFSDNAPQDALSWSILGKLADLSCNYCWGRGYEVINGRQSDCRCMTLYLKRTEEILSPVKGDAKHGKQAEVGGNVTAPLVTEDGKPVGVEPGLITG